MPAIDEWLEAATDEYSQHLRSERRAGASRCGTPGGVKPGEHLAVLFEPFYTTQAEGMA